MRRQGQADKIELLRFDTPPMRAFHMSWIAFFLCFCGWFGIAPLMQIVREEMQFTKEQVGWCVIGSVAATIFARLLVGWLCDRVGPRLAYTWLLLLSALPVMAIGLTQRFETFLLFRVLIGAAGASFVITQYHTSIMFAPRCVGAANATTAGWGNLGGGVVQVAMPLLLGGLVAVLGCSEAVGWRLSMVVAGAACAAAGVAYFFLTQDTPEGNFRELRAAGKLPGPAARRGGFLEACRDRRVWALAVAYGACFGIELTIHNVALLYFVDYFDYFRSLDAAAALRTAGVLASLFGLMSLFARTLGGALGDRCGRRWGLSGRVKWLFIVLFAEGLSLMLFAQMRTLTLAVPALVLFGLAVQMSAGATFAVVPFVNRRALGAVSGIVGAGGNVGAVASGFLFKSEALDWPAALFVLGAAVTVCSFASLAVTFSPQAESEARSPVRPRSAAGEALAPAPT